MIERETRELRQAFADAASSSAVSGGCPPAAALWDSARSILDRGANEATVLHVGECGACAAAWRVARILDPGDTVARAQRPGRRLERWRSLTLALAASVALVAGGLALWFRPGLEPPALRAPRADWLRPAGDQPPLGRSDPVLRWTPGPEGTLYDVRVTNEDLEVLQVGWRLNAAELRLDAHVLDLVSDGEAIHWQVTATLPDGRVVDSPTFTTPVR